MKSLRSRPILAAFLSLLLLFSIIGYVAGLKATREYTLADAFEELQLIRLNGAVKIAHLCDGETTHVYDPEHGVETNPEILAKAASGFSPSRVMSPGRHTELVAALAGGAAGGLTLQKIKVASQTRFRKMRIPKALIMITGVGAGYLAGYSLAYRETYSCKHPEKLSLLSKSQFWESVGSSFVPLWLWQHDIVPDHWGGQEPPEDRPKANFSPLFYCSSPEIEAAARLWESVGSSWSVKNRDLANLYKVALVLNERRGEADLRHSFTGCVFALEERVYWATRNGTYQENGVSHAWRQGDSIPLPLRCTKASGRTEPLSEGEYANLRASDWMKSLCQKELSRPVP